MLAVFASLALALHGDVVLPDAAPEVLDDESPLESEAEPREAPARDMRHTMLRSTAITLAFVGSAAGVLAMGTVVGAALAGVGTGAVFAWFLDSFARGFGGVGLTPGAIIGIIAVVGAVMWAVCLLLGAYVLAVPLPVVEWAVFTAVFAAHARDLKAVLMTSGAGLVTALAAALVMGPLAIAVLVLSVWGMAYLGNLLAPQLSGEQVYLGLMIPPAAALVTVVLALGIAAAGVLVVRPVAAWLSARDAW